MVKGKWFLPKKKKVSAGKISPPFGNLGLETSDESRSKLSNPVHFRNLLLQMFVMIN